MASARQTKPVQILDSVVNMVDIPYIVDWLEQEIISFREAEKQGKPLPPVRQMLVTGFHGLNQARKDPAYHRIGAECDLWVPDSIAPVLIARKRGMRNVVRTPGAELMTAFLERADQKGFSSYFYGDSERTLTALKENLERRFPGHRIAGMFSPPFRPLSDAEEAEHVEAINTARPDVLWVGLGLPKQDEWIYRNRHRLKVPVASGVGAAFGFLAGTVQRAPDWCLKCGLEWAYMLARKPKRTARRVFVDGGEFVWASIKEEFFTGKK